MGSTMPPQTYDRLIAFGERIGAPTALLVLILVGLYNLGDLLVDAGIAYMDAQTAALHEMSIDIKNTRILVERGAAEGKVELIAHTTEVSEEGFKKLEVRINALEARILNCNERIEKLTE